MLFGIQAYSQQQTSFNHAYYSPFLYNPAFAGAGNKAEIIGLSRMQWAGADRSLSSALITAGMPLAKNMAIGARLSSEKLGLIGNTDADLIFAYHLPLDQQSTLSLGISAGISTLSVSTSKLNATDLDDQVLFNADHNRSLLQGDIGISYRREEFDFGISAPALIGQRKWAGTIAEDNRRQFIFSTAYRFSFGQAIVEPRAIFKTVSTYQGKMETMLTLYLKERFWAGGIYRFDYGPAFYGGFKISQHFKTGYAYEPGPTRNPSPIGATHELCLSYQFPKKGH